MKSAKPTAAMALVWATLALCVYVLIASITLKSVILVSPAYALQNALFGMAAYFLWLVYALYRGNQMAGMLALEKDRVEMEVHQLSTIIAGLGLMGSVFTGLYKLPDLAGVASEELILVGSGTVVNWLQGQKVGDGTELSTSRRSAHLTILPTVSQGGVSTMASSTDFGSLTGPHPTVVGLASYDIAATDEALRSERIAEHYYKITIAESEIVLLRNAGNDEGQDFPWPAEGQYQGNMLDFLKAHKVAVASADVRGGNPSSGTRLALELEIAKKRLAPQLESSTSEERQEALDAELKTVSELWTKNLGNETQGLTVDALRSGNPMVMWGSDFRTAEGQWLDKDSLQAYADKHKIEMIRLGVNRPLVIVGRWEKPPPQCLLPASVQVLLDKLGTVKEYDADTGKLTTGTSWEDLVPR